MPQPEIWSQAQAQGRGQPRSTAGGLALADGPQRVYQLLLDRVARASCAQLPVDEVLIGLTWTLCRGSDGGDGPAPLGLAMSPQQPTRVLPWPGTLSGRPLGELTPWVQSWNIHEATVGMAAVNAVLNTASAIADAAEPLVSDGPANLAVFRHFADQLAGASVVVVGRYPGLDGLALDWQLTVLERAPADGDLPDPAAEYLLPGADWVFLTATSLINKTFPRLAQLSRRARVVLMGPTVPWLAELGELGVDYLAGVGVTHAGDLRRTVAEGGGTRIFETGVQYRVLAL